MDSTSENKLSLLFESLVGLLIKEKTVKQSDRQFTDMLFKILSKKEMNRSKLFANSALYVDKTIANSLVEEGLIQLSASDGQDKFCLTFKGIAEVLRSKYNVPYEKQFHDYLNDLDKTYSAIDKSDFTWKEQLASMSLLLVGSTSANSAVILDSKGNVDLMTEVFEKVLFSFQKYGLINDEAMLTTGVRGEPPVLFLINRLQDLPKKTNHYYRNPGKSVHYFELEDGERVNEQRVLFLLKKIFINYRRDVAYAKLCEELQNISIKYSPGFSNRKVMQRNIFDTNAYLQEFFQDVVHKLPPLTAKTEVNDKM